MMKTNGSNIWMNRLGLYEPVGCVMAISELTLSRDMRDRTSLVDKGPKHEAGHEAYDGITFDVLLEVDSGVLLGIHNNGQHVDYVVGVGDGGEPIIGHQLPSSRWWFLFSGTIETFEINALESNEVVRATITVRLSDAPTIITPRTVLWDNETPWDNDTAWR